MTDGKLRIPRMAVAVLVLGAACGDEEKSSDRPDTGGEPDEGHAGHDGGDSHGEHDSGDDPHPQHDAGAGGGADDGGPEAGDIDVSNARIQQVAEDFCRQGFACESETVLANYADEAECTADSVSYWRDYVDVLGADCIDAQLDLYACYAAVSCEEIEDACEHFAHTTAELCPTED